MKKRSKFSLSHYRLFSCKMGYLVPIGLVEVLPGDTFQHATSLFLRVSPLVTPVMHPVHVIVHHWYVPTRLLWENWETFITGGPDGMDASVPPTYTPHNPAGFGIGSLADYLGCPTQIPGLEVSDLPFRAYHLVWNECYRDQDLETEVDIPLTDGPHAPTNLWGSVHKSDWSRDYFTTARPWPQKGPQVTVPVNSPGDRKLQVVPSSDMQPFKLRFQTSTTFSDVPDGVVDVATQNTVASQPGSLSTWPANPSLHWAYTNNNAGGPNLVAGNVYWPKATGLQVDVSSSSGDLGSIDINQLREAFALQRFEEHRALYGSRYVEYLRYLGVRSSDARLQRPEYLGGSKQTIQFSEVLQTAEGTDPVGTLRGHGIAASRTPRYRRFFEEHGYVLSIMQVRPVSVYMQGLPRMWRRKVKEDYFQRELQHIGQQEVYTSEVYAGNSNGVTDAEKVFGYQNRYDEYRWHGSYVSGEFRTILDSWHMARNFAQEPVLNSDFISGPPTNRIFAAQDNDTLYCMANHSIQARRLMSKHGNPI